MLGSIDLETEQDMPMSREIGDNESTEMHFDTMHLSRCVQSELELISALSGKLRKAIRRPSLHSEGEGAWATHPWVLGGSSASQPLFKAG